MSSSSHSALAHKQARELQAVAIVDLGGQYCHMIGRRLRDVGVRSDIFSHEIPAHRLALYSGIILSGGPQSVNDPAAPTVDRRLLDLHKPILGICYGHQLIAKWLGCDVRSSGGEEYGKTKLTLRAADSLFAGTPKHQTVWMSHGDSVHNLSGGLRALATTDNCAVAAFSDAQKKIYGVQFHPEVGHTKWGTDLLRNFSREICGITERESIEDRVARLLKEIRATVGSQKVLFFVSGGVDSTVAFSLCARALPRHQVLGVYVDTGFMRKNETDELKSILTAAGLADRLEIRNEAGRFLEALENECDPEEKRKKIGGLFVDVQRRALHDYGIDQKNWILGQGTIYPDTVESGGRGQTTALIKTHHNRCEEIRLLIAQGKVIEPLSEFYKDEVRKVGAALGLGPELTQRWPFPGPGLAIRVLCNNHETEVKAVADELPMDFSGYEAAHFPIQSVGVQGDFRTYRDVLAVRGRLNYARLDNLATTLCNKDKRYNRVIAFLEGKVGALSDGTIQPRKLHADRIDLLREADDVVKNAIQGAGLLQSVWQFPVILIPISFSKGETIVLRPVNSDDGMTASFARLPVRILRKIGRKICQIPGIDAVFLDVTNKPPATIEWE